MNKTLFKIQPLKGTFLLLNLLFTDFVFGQEKVLDLGAIEIKGEVRRPNVKLVYSKKKGFNKALSTIAQEEMRAFEKELLKPSSHKGRDKAP